MNLSLSNRLRTAVSISPEGERSEIPYNDKIIVLMLETSVPLAFEALRTTWYYQLSVYIDGISYQVNGFGRRVLTQPGVIFGGLHPPRLNLSFLLFPFGKRHLEKSIFECLLLQPHLHNGQSP
jgi:hypothetical protein